MDLCLSGHNAKECVMKKETLMNLQNVLKTQRKQILSNGKLLRIDFTTSDDERKDEVDLAVNDIQQGMSMRLGNRESLYFKKIEEALLRIKEGTYGLCLSCGHEIGLKRLEVRPTAELCIECKEQEEKKENVSADGRRSKSLGVGIDFKA